MTPQQPAKSWYGANSSKLFIHLKDKKKIEKVNVFSFI